MKKLLELMNTKSAAKRLGWLFGGFAISFVLWSLLYCNQAWLDDLPYAIQATLIAFVGLPIAFVLWVFRTHDTTENLFSNAFYKGIELLHSEHTVNSGVDLLIGLSKDAPRVFDDRIGSAFTLLLMNGQPYTAQVQNILVWLHGRGKLKGVLEVVQDGRRRLGKPYLNMDSPYTREFCGLCNRDQEFFRCLKDYFVNILHREGEMDDEEFLEIAKQNLQRLEKESDT